MRPFYFTLLVLLLTAPLALSAQGRMPGQASGRPDATVLLDSTHVMVTDNGSGTFTIRKTVKMESERGALSNRVVKYDYDPLTAFARFTHISVTHSDGTVTTINPATACDYAAPARSIYWGARQIMAQIGRLAVGDVLDYTIEKKGFTYALLLDGPVDEDKFIPPMRGHFYDIVPFWVSQPTAKKCYVVSVPKDKELQYEFYNGACATSVRFDGNYTTYSFTKYNCTPELRESNAVDNYDRSPKLFLSSTQKWIEKSLWFNKVNEDYGSFDPLPEAQAKVDELLLGVTDEMERISILTHWVADNMRYSGISMGEGEGYTLHNTKTNFTDRCGVCKDKAGMLISMLRMAGHPAYPAMTMAGSRIESIPADHFNHCVVVVKLSSGKYIPLDPTWVPFIRELWSSAEQQQNYLPGIPEGSDLMLTPTSDPDNHYLRMKANTVLAADGTLSGTVTVYAEGQTDGSIRRPFTQGYQDNIQASLEAELLRISPKAVLIKADAGKNPADYQKAPLALTYTFRIPGYATVGGSSIVCTPLIFSNLYRSNKNFTSVNIAQETRQFGFSVRCSQRVTLDETLTLPKGYSLVTPDASTPLTEGQVATFEGSRSSNGSTVTLHQEVTLYKRIYEAADWSEFRNAVMGYNAYANTPLVLTKN